MTVPVISLPVPTSVTDIIEVTSEQLSATNSELVDFFWIEEAEKIQRALLTEKPLRFLELLEIYFLSNSQREWLCKDIASMLNIFMSMKYEAGTKTMIGRIRSLANRALWAESNVTEIINTLGELKTYFEVEMTAGKENEGYQGLYLATLIRDTIDMHQFVNNH